MGPSLDSGLHRVACSFRQDLLRQGATQVEYCLAGISPDIMLSRQGPLPPPTGCSLIKVIPIRMLPEAGSPRI